MRRIAIVLLPLLAGCSAASPPSSASLAASLEQVVGALNATRSYTQATQIRLGCMSARRR
jgi:hypothetical protein